MKCDFRVGEEVICIAGIDELETGKSYIIYSVNITGAGTHGFKGLASNPCPQDLVFVNVNCSRYEKEANARGHPEEAGWHHWRFRRPEINEEDTDLREALRVWGPQGLVGRQFKLKVKA